MTSALLAFYAFAGIIEAGYVRARERSRGVAKVI